MIEVTAAIIENSQGELLICKRGPGGSCGHLWEFPGGKREAGEALSACVLRECREELGVELALLGVYESFTYSYPDRDIAFTFFKARIKSGALRMRVHEDLRWARREELEKFPFCPADAGLVARLMGEAT